MAVLTKYFIAILFLSFISKGLCVCALDNITIGTVRSGREIQGKPEWNVTVTNNCRCPQKLLKLTCEGFQTVEKVDPLIFSMGDDHQTCLLLQGGSLRGSASVKFSYAWDPPSLLWPSSSLLTDCGR
ncbi:uncharacterized protein LOC133870640 [Alnus glutinosa]|uniref:uncharacterized protein LOC133870640 n=1 Tax=Alnus glutinosa TaxID=3517 RepID=UPI002D77A629|nr:uncharacterized protein LOC133870640 [Alnus glutinosa]